MIRTRTGLLACLLAAASIAAGCGSSDDKSDTSGGGGGGGGTPTTLKGAVDKCIEQAKSVKDKDARKTATEACKAAKSGNTSKVKDAVRKECLKAVEQLPDSAGAQKEEAKKRCEAVK
jgi:hypothetical protein